MTDSQAQAMTSGKKKRQRGWWYPWIFVAFFAVIITVNSIMMYFAFSTWTGLETKDHYLKGLAYDDRIAQVKAQEALGWTTVLEYQTIEENDKARKIAYRLIMLDHNQKAIDGLKAHSFFIRPTHEGLDVNAPAEMIEPGVVGGEIELPLAGQWDARIYTESMGRKFQHVERIVVK